MMDILKDNELDKNKITGGFFKYYQDLAVEHLVPYQLNIFFKNDGLKTLLKMAGYHVQTEGKGRAHLGGTLIEGIAYSLMLKKDPELRKKMDEVVDALEANQLHDGYLNPFMGSTHPDWRFMSLLMSHEGFGLGHLMEGLLTYYRTTGNEKALKISKGIGDCLYEWFGYRDDQIHGYCGHPGVEPALYRLYKFTGEKKYFDVLKFFVDERGQEGPGKPHYFDWEQERNLKKYGKAVIGNLDWWADEHRPYWGHYEYFQAHKPARQIEEPTGHAVRATYFYMGMADVAAESGDAELLAACKKIFAHFEKDNIYLNGAIGQDFYWEGVGRAYDLPPDYGYNETCASIGLFLFAHRMQKIEKEAHYADVMEQTFLNSILAGVGLDGEHYFYCNPLEVIPETLYRFHHDHNVLAKRYTWHDCPCCPPNIARLLGGLSQFIFTYDAKNIYVNLYCESEGTCDLGYGPVKIEMKTTYPLTGGIALTVKDPGHFSLRLRIPGWCSEYSLEVNGAKENAPVEKGYAVLTRDWKAGDTIALKLSMPVRRVYANPKVFQYNCQTAVMRGPLLYCLEQVDNGPVLSRISLPKDALLEEKYEKDLLGGVYTVTAQGERVLFRDSALYDGERPKREKFIMKFVPYYAWANREEGEMRVFVFET
jgi:DUF1680 family protein